MVESCLITDPVLKCHLNTGLNFVRYSDMNPFLNDGLNTGLPFEYGTSKTLLFRCFFYLDAQLFRSLILQPSVNVMGFKQPGEFC